MVECCGVCGRRGVLRAVDGSVVTYYCPQCGFVPSVKDSPKNALAKVAVGRSVRARREAELVEAIVEALKVRGYEVKRIGQRRPDLAGTDAGVADVQVNAAWSATPLWLALEVKVPGEGVFSEEQRRLVEAGLNLGVWSVDEAVLAAETWFGKRSGA